MFVSSAPATGSCIDGAAFCAVSCSGALSNSAFTSGSALGGAAAAGVDLDAGSSS